MPRDAALMLPPAAGASPRHAMLMLISLIMAPPFSLPSLITIHDAAICFSAVTLIIDALRLRCCRFREAYADAFSPPQSFRRLFSDAFCAFAAFPLIDACYAMPPAMMLSPL